MANTGEQVNDDSFKAQLSERLKTASTSDRYLYVKVLLFYWEPANSRDVLFRDEGRLLGGMFTDAFNFAVQEFPIPLDDPELSVQGQLSAETILANKHVASGNGKALLIVHYGGHGDTDEQGAVWATTANPYKEEPLVHWSQIQGTFERSRADVLALLDCCFSGAASRARSPLGRFEILTAASKQEMTPGPGPFSFTTAIMKLLKDAIATESSITVSSLHSGLLKKEAGLLATALNVVVRPGFPDRSIKLSPLGHDDLMMLKTPQGPVIRVLIRTADLQPQRVEELASWLRSDIPSDISLEVEDIIRRTVSLQTLVRKVDNRDEPVGKVLEADTAKGIADLWNKISDLLSAYQGQRKQLLGAHPLLRRLEEEARNFLDQLESYSEDLIDSVEQGLLRSVRNDDDLEKAIHVPEVETLGIANQLRMRQMILHPERHRSLAVESDPDLGRHGRSNAWKEHKHYGQYLDPALLGEVQQRLSLLANLLGASKSPAFRSLSCSRCWHDAAKKQFVLEFDIPPEYNLSSGGFYWRSLKDIITKTKRQSRPTLGQRFSFARAVAQAVHQWHSVGWVHQSINAYNIIFFQRVDKIDYLFPFLQGFDFARPHVGRSLGQHVDDPATNVYRHPDRQGPSREGHTKLHDIYSLGVVLLEVGLWEDACITAKVNKEHDVTVEEMETNLKEAAVTRLAHYMGRDYQEFVLLCLSSDFGVHVDDKLGSFITKAFQQKLAEKLAAASVLR